MSPHILLEKQTRFARTVHTELGSVEKTPAAPYHDRKHVVERVLAVLLLIPALPIICLMVLLVRLTSGGPGLLRQARVGRDGKLFVIWKIRTMHAGEEKKETRTCTQPGDPRLTRLGRILRKAHLDELPQLFNVVNGDMALVGPRPLRPEVVEVLTQQNPGYMKRFRILPGITGLAQVCMGPELDRDSIAQKLALDLAYVQRANLFLDLKILGCTASLLFAVPKRLAVRAVGLRKAYLGDGGRRPAFGRRPGAYPAGVPARVPARNGRADSRREGFRRQESPAALHEAPPR